MLSNEAIQLRVEELLQQMTLEEKVAQMMQIPYSVVGREESLRWAKLGAGSFLHVLGDNAREVQRAAMENSRLGIPVIFGIDAIHGHGLKHDPFNAIVAPRPIGWISSRDKGGNVNLAANTLDLGVKILFHKVCTDCVANDGELDAVGKFLDFGGKLKSGFALGNGKSRKLKAVGNGFGVAHGVKDGISVPVHALTVAVRSY